MLEREALQAILGRPCALLGPLPVPPVATSSSVSCFARPDASAAGRGDGDDGGGGGDDVERRRRLLSHDGDDDEEEEEELRRPPRRYRCSPAVAKTLTANETIRLNAAIERGGDVSYLRSFVRSFASDDGRSNRTRKKGRKGGLYPTSLARSISFVLSRHEAHVRSVLADVDADDALGVPYVASRCDLSWIRPLVDLVRDVVVVLLLSPSSSDDDESAWGCSLVDRTEMAHRNAVGSDPATEGSLRVARDGLRSVLWYQIRCWTERGRLVDPHDEFFVVDGDAASAGEEEEGEAGAGGRGGGGGGGGSSDDDDDDNAAGGTTRLATLRRSRVPTSILSPAIATKILFAGNARRTLLSRRRRRRRRTTTTVAASSSSLRRPRDDDRGARPASIDVARGAAAASSSAPRDDDDELGPVELERIATESYGSASADLCEHLRVDCHLVRHLRNLRSSLLLGDGWFSADLAAACDDADVWRTVRRIAREERRRGRDATTAGDDDDDDGRMDRREMEARCLSTFRERAFRPVWNRRYGLELRDDDGDGGIERRGGRRRRRGALPAAAADGLDGSDRTELADRLSAAMIFPPPSGFRFRNFAVRGDGGDGDGGGGSGGLRLCGAAVRDPVRAAIRLVAPRPPPPAGAALGGGGGGGDGDGWGGALARRRHDPSVGFVSSFAVRWERRRAATDDDGGDREGDGEGDGDGSYPASSDAVCLVLTSSPDDPSEDVSSSLRPSVDVPSRSAPLGSTSAAASTTRVVVVQVDRTTTTDGSSTLRVSVNGGGRSGPIVPPPGGGAWTIRARGGALRANGGVGVSVSFDDGDGSSTPIEAASVDEYPPARLCRGGDGRARERRAVAVAVGAASSDAGTGCVLLRWSFRTATPDDDDADEISPGTRTERDLHRLALDGVSVRGEDDAAAASRAALAEIHEDVSSKLPLIDGVAEGGGGGDRRRGRPASGPIPDLRYRLPVPLRLVVLESTLRDTYGAAFRRTLTIERASHELRRCWRDVAAATTGPPSRSSSSSSCSTRTVLRVRLLRSRMDFVVSNLLTHFKVDVVDVSFRRLESDVVGATDVDGARESHGRFAATLRRSCFLDDGAWGDAWSRLFALVHRFAAVARRGGFGGDDGTGGGRWTAEMLDGEIGRISVAFDGETARLLRTMRKCDAASVLCLRLDYNGFYSRLLSGVGARER